MERRTLEVRAAVEGNRLVGHAAVFDQSELIRDFYESVDRRAFGRVLRERQDTVLQVDHAGMPLARTTSGTLRLGVDSTGLTIDADLADTTLGRDVRTLVDRGDLSKMSFGFQVAEDAWHVRKDGAQHRTILDVGRLFDVSVVTFPAYAGTDVALRAAVYGDLPKIPTRPSVRGQVARIRWANRKASQ